MSRHERSCHGCILGEKLDEVRWTLASTADVTSKPDQPAVSRHFDPLDPNTH